MNYVLSDGAKARATLFGDGVLQKMDEVGRSLGVTLNGDEAEMAFDMAFDELGSSVAYGAAVLEAVERVVASRHDGQL